MKTFQKENPTHSIIIPAYNEGDVIKQVLLDIQNTMARAGTNYEILVIDDGSTDNTAEEAHGAGVIVIQHPYNIGYGAALKTGIRRAKGAYLITIDSDGQHDPNDIPRLMNEIGKFDMVVGNRTQKSDTEKHRDFANFIFNSFASYIAGRRIDDLTSGLRVMKTQIVKKFLYLLPNTFSCSSTMTLANIHAGYSLKYMPIKVRKRQGKGKSKIKPINDGFRFLLLILRIAVFYSPLKIFLPISLSIFLLGLGYGLFRIFIWGVNYGQTSSLLMSTAVLILMVGLVSEQIAQLRFNQSEADTSTEFYNE